jgi:ubiquinone/menaquinone biosynthesis C-methylase UbiE
MSWFFKEVRHAKLYLKYRPTYPKEVYETIYGFLEENASIRRWQLAVDVGCGTGQSTVPLCERFDRVVGVDQSVAQLDEARNALTDAIRSKVTYRVSSYDDLSFVEDSSVDLVTSAMAMQYFDVDKFYPEILRVLRPGGVLAAYGYALAQIHKPEGHRILLELYHQKLRGYFSDHRNHIDNLYRDLFESFAVAFPLSKRVDSVAINRQFSVDEFIGYLSSWSAYHHYMQKHSGDDDLLEVVKNEFLKVFTGAASEHTMDVTFPVFILLGKKNYAADG